MVDSSSLAAAAVSGAPPLLEPVNLAGATEPCGPPVQVAQPLPGKTVQLIAAHPESAGEPEGLERDPAANLLQLGSLLALLLAQPLPELVVLPRRATDFGKNFAVP
jgi:hypothetical protein